jgi:hypothetical protein
MSRKSAFIRVAGVMSAVAALSACAGQPETIVASDEALCQYSATATDAKSYTQCREWLRSRSGRLIAANASRIEGYALLQGPLPPTGVAGHCKNPEGAKNCDSGDLTGSIPVESKR